MIDCEKLVADYLRDHPSVGGHVGSKTPPTSVGTWITVVQLDATAVDGHRSDHLVDYLIQCSVYAGSVPQVWTLALAARAVLRELPGIHDDTVVTGVRFGSMPRTQDTDREPARERVTLTINVYAHPA